MSRIALVTRNYERQVSFYRDHLGFDLARQWDRDGARGALLKWFDGFQIEILDARREKEPLNTDQANDRIHLVLTVNGLAEYLNQRQIGGGENTSWGGMVCRFKDPDGNPICLMESTLG